MPNCSVKGCLVGAEGYKGPKFKLFVFPQDEEEKKVWLDRIQRPDMNVTKNSRICERHFVPEAFISEDEKRSKKRERVRKTVKPKAFPTLFLGSKVSLLKQCRKESKKNKLFL